MSDLDRQATGIDYDEPQYHFCKKCGNEMAWADCWQINCEEGQYDEYEDDAINFAPGSYRNCETCKGKGGWWYCENPACSTAGKGEGQ